MAAKKKAIERKVISKVEEAVENKKVWYSWRSYSRNQLIYIFAAVAVVAFLGFNFKQLVIAATVNGQPISRLTVLKQLEQQQGQQVLENLINESLIHQAARKQNINVAKSEIDDRVAEIEADLVAQGQTLESVLDLQGLTRGDLDNQIELQLLAERLLADNVEITAEEVAAFIEANVDFLPEDLSEEEINSQAEEQIRQQKLSQEFNDWLLSQRDDSNIQFFVEY